MPIHLDDLLGDFNAQHRRHDGLPGDKVNLDDVLDSSIDPAVSGLHAMGLSVPDVIGAAGRGVAHLVGIPTELPHTAGEAAHDLATSPLTAPMMGIYGPIASTADVVKGFAGAKRRFGGSPSTTSKTRAVVSQVPMVGPALDELLGPTEASIEGRPQTRAENLGAIEGGATLGGMALLPKITEGLRGEPAAGMARESAEKPTTTSETTSSPSATPPAPTTDIFDLVEQAGQAQEVARNRPPEGTWQERTVAALERPRTASDELIGGETPNLTLKAEAARRAGNMPHLDDLLAEPADMVGAHVSGMDVGLPPEEVPPSSPVGTHESGADIGTDWINELPVAEQTAAPPEEPLPAGLADEPAPQTGLPEQLTSEPQRAAGSSAEQVGTDATQQLETARTERDGVIKAGLKKGSQIFNALVVPGDDVLLRSGEAGQEAVRTTRPIELRRAMAVGKADSLYHELTASMTPEERAAIPMVMDGQMAIDSPNVTARVRTAIPIVRKFFDDYLARAEAAGTGVERRQDYFPHFREAPVHDIEKPLPEFQKFGMESPSLHFHQVDERPGYSMDLGYVMRRYAYNAETELQAMQAFGGANADAILGKINEWSDKIAATGGDGVLAKKILLEKFNMQEPELPASRKLTRDVGALVGTMNTVTTPIRHIGKYVNALSQIGFRGAAKGLGEMAKVIVDPAARARIRESGVLLRNSFDLVMPNTKENAFYRVTRAMPWIKATKALDAGGRVMTYFGSDPWIDETVGIARGDRQYLGSVTEGMRRRAIEDAYNRAHNIFGISDESIKAGKVRPDEREYARLAASDVTEFSPERGQLPYAATVGAAGRLFYNLRKFATSQANFMYNNVVKPATYGNIKPMARFLAGSALAGAAIEPLLHMVNRQPDMVLNYFGVPLRPEGDQGWNDWSKKAMAVGAIHNLGLIYLLVEGRDIMQAVPTASAGLLARGVHGAASDFVNAARQSAGVPSESDKEGVGLPEWWDQAQENIGSMEGRNIKDIARSTQLTWLMRKWYREARGLHDQ